MSRRARGLIWSETPKLLIIYKVFLGDFGEWLSRTGRARDFLHGENGGFRPVIYLARALDSRLDPDYIKIRVEKEN
jgi:hypothetical protein